MKKKAKPTFVVYGPHSWGSGDTLEEAKVNFKKNYGKLIEGYGILEFDKDTEFLGFDGLGRYTYQRRDGVDQTPTPPVQKLIKGRGKKT